MSTQNRYSMPESGLIDNKHSKSGIEDSNLSESYQPSKVKSSINYSKPSMSLRTSKNDRVTTKKSNISSKNYDFDQSNAFVDDELDFGESKLTNSEIQVDNS